MKVRKASTIGPMRVAILASALSAVISCGGDGAETTTGQEPANSAAEVVRGCSDGEAGAPSGDGEAFSFHGLEDWVRDASTIALVSVASESAGNSQDPPIEGEESETARDLTLTIERTYLGSPAPGSEFAIRAHEPYFGDGDDRTIATGPGCFGLLVGDRAVVALFGSGESADASSLLTGDSVFLVVDDTIATTRRVNPALDEFEGKPLSYLEERLRSVGAGG